MTIVKCNMEDCYWRMDGHCSCKEILIKDYHCENFRHYIKPEILYIKPEVRERPGREDEHYYYCSMCGSKEVYIDDNFCSHCGVRFIKDEI